MYICVCVSCRLFELYMLMQQKLYSDAWPIKIYYHLGNSEAIMAWVRPPGHVLYLNTASASKVGQN